MSVADIAWIRWDDDHIAFHRPSGKTHLLNEVCNVLLTDILVEPHSTREVLAELQARVESPLDEQYAADLAITLERLEQLGLVERA